MNITKNYYCKKKLIVFMVVSLFLILFYVFNAKVIILSVCGAQNAKQIPRANREKYDIYR